MKRSLALPISLAFAGLTAACSHDRDVTRDSGSGVRDSKKAGATSPASMPNMPEHGTANLESRTESRIPNPESRQEITLTPDMIQRAGIKTVAAMKATATTRLHLPGVVQPNAYKNVDVTSLVSGRVTQVRAELGQRVMANEVLATVYSPELADAQTAFIAARAARTAHG